MLPALICLGAFTALGQEPTLATGAKLPPYSFLLSIGEQRGRSHCYVCESQEKPVIIVFVRAATHEGKPAFPSAKITQTAQILDEALAKRENLASWMTLMNARQEGLDGPIVKWAAEAGLRNLPVGVFEDPLGPPAYRLSPGAAMTAVIARNGKVEKTLVYRETDAAADFHKAIGAELDRIAPIPVKPVVENKPVVEAKPAAEAKPKAEEKPNAEAKPEAKPKAEEKPKTETKSEVKPPAEPKRVTEEKPKTPTEKK